MTEGTLRPRLIAFALLAAASGVTVMCALSVLAVKGALADLPGAIRSFQRSIGPFLFIGLPIAVLLEAIVGLPVLRYLRRRGRVERAPVLATASLSGGIGYTALMSVMPGFRIPDVALTAFTIGALGGLVAGIVLWAGLAAAPQPRLY